MALREFGKCFNLGCHKEVVPYGIYTHQNVDMGVCCVQDALDILKDDDQQQFLNNLGKWDCILGKGMDNQMFGSIEYSSIYCKMDCEILMDGYEVFRGWMLEHTDLDVCNSYYNSIHGFIIYVKSRCYGNVYQTSGVLQQFISRCVVSGRVMTNSDTQYHVKRKIADFDACSLNPSAMHYMDGFLEDKPKVINDKPYEFLNKQDGYFIIIKINKINKHLDFPLTSKIHEDGVRDFVNDVENGIIYIGEVG